MTIVVAEKSGTKIEDVLPVLQKPWWRYSHLLRLNFHLLGSIFVLVNSGFDSTMMNNLQTLPSWTNFFNNPSGGTLGTMNIGIPAGSLCCIPFAFILNDLIGRRMTVLLGLAFTIIGGALQTAAQNFGMFVASRFILGFGVGLSSAGAGPILSETAYPTQRPAVTSFLLASFPLGSFVAAVVTWGPYNSSMKYNNWSWRLPSLLQIVFPIFSVVAVALGPESPRWLISKGREDKALQVLAKHHGAGDLQSPLVKFELSEIKAAIELEKAQGGNKWKEWVRTKSNMHRLFINLALPAMMQFCGNALISYYLNIILNNIGYTETTEKLKINIGLTLYGLAWSYGVSILCGRFKRTGLLITSYALMSFFFIIWIVLSAINQQRDFKDKAIGRAIVAMIYLYQGCYHISTPIAMTYIMEILPFSLRGMGAALYQLSGNTASLFNNYVNNIAMDAIQWKYYIVWCVWLLVQIAIVYFFFPETYGLQLEEIAQVFGDDVTYIMAASSKAVGDGDGYLESSSTKENVSAIENIGPKKSPV